MTTLTARFDGRVLVPEEPVSLPMDCVLKLQVEPVCPEEESPFPLAELAEWAATLPDNPDAPTDAAPQHDHYLYGTPKRP
jgi:hypothetical protein